MDENNTRERLIAVLLERYGHPGSPYDGVGDREVAAGVVDLILAELNT